MANDELLVASPTNNAVLVFARTATHTSPPLRTLAEPATGLGVALAVAVTTVTPPPPVIPTLGEWGLLAMSGLLALAMLWAIRRRPAA